MPSSSREDSTERPGFFHRPGPGLLSASTSRSATKHSSPKDRACFSPSLCLLFLVCLTDFRWGSLRIEQARAVLTKLERKVKVFLSLAKEPFSKTPQLWTEWRSFLSSPGNNDFVTDAIPSVFLFPLYPHLYFFFLLHLFQNGLSCKRSGG